MRSLADRLAGLFGSRFPAVLAALLGLVSAACPPAGKTVEIVWTEPADGATFVFVETKISITFSKYMDPKSLNDTCIRLVPSNSPGTFLSGAVVYDEATRIATFTPTALLNIGTKYVVSLWGVKGAHGEVLTSHGFSFTTESGSGPPRVLSVAPADHATGVPVDTAVEVVFTKAMSPCCTNASHVALVSSWDDPAIWDVAGTVTYDSTDHRMTFTPSAALQPNTDYSLVLKDMWSADYFALMPTEGAAVSRFRTAPSTGAPAVVFTRPADGGIAIPGSAYLMAHFNKAMDPATVTTATFRVTRSDTGASVAGRPSYDPGSGSAYFNPPPFACGASYSVVLDGLKDLQGNPLTSNTALPGYRFSFVTSLACIDVNGTPRGDIIPLRTQVAAHFGEAMDPATVRASTFLLSRHDTGASVAGSVTYDAVERLATFAPAVPLDPSSQYDVVLSGMHGLTGHLLRDFNHPDGSYRWSFTTDGAGSWIASTNPLSSSQNVPVDTTVSIVFNRALDPVTVNSQSIIANRSGPNVPGMVRYDPATYTATFTPSALLDPGQIRITVWRLKASDGTDFTGMYSFWFNTESAPYVPWTSPLDGTPGVPVDGTVTVTFTRPMDPATVTASNFSVMAGSSSVSGAVTYDPVGYVATFTPAAPLAPTATYDVRLSGLRGLHGLPLTANQSDGSYRFAFHTGEAGCSGARVLCSGACVDIASDPGNCGGCGVHCAVPVGGATSCVGGVCAPNCTAPRVLCLPPGGAAFCADTSVDPNNCGGCGIACGAHSSCLSGTCVPYLLVVATLPSSGAVNVPWTDFALMATFDHPLDCTTVTPATFHVAAGGVDAAGSVQCGGTDNTMVRFMPGPMPLQPATTYTARLETQIRSAGGLVLQAPYSWSFTTAP